MKLMAVKESRIQLVSSTPVPYNALRITQISSDEDAGFIPRGESFSSMFIPDPIMIISINTLDTTGLKDNTFLARILLQSSISTFDVYGTANGTAGQNTQVDTFNVDAALYASRGRLLFDLRKYATSQVQLILTPLNMTGAQAIIRMEVFTAASLG